MLNHQQESKKDIHISWKTKSSPCYLPSFYCSALDELSKHSEPWFTHVGKAKLWFYPIRLQGRQMRYGIWKHFVNRSPGHMALCDSRGKCCRNIGSLHTSEFKLCLSHLWALWPWVVYVVSLYCIRSFIHSFFHSFFITNFHQLPVFLQLGMELGIDRQNSSSKFQ